MNYSREAIENFSEFIRTVLKLNRPYDPELAVKNLGGTIVQNITNMAIDASISKKGDTGFIIRLNRNKPNPKDRLLIAHELGHLFLHMGYLVNNELWKSQEKFQDSVYYRMSGSYTQEEAEADTFAMAFLMPENEFMEGNNQKTNASRTTNVQSYGMPDTYYVFLDTIDRIYTDRDGEHINNLLNK